MVFFLHQNALVVLAGDMPTRRATRIWCFQRPETMSNGLPMAAKPVNGRSIILALSAHASMAVRVAATKTAQTARRPLQDRHCYRGDPIALDHDVADRRPCAAIRIRLQLERADRLAQEGAALPDRRELGGIQIEPGRGHWRGWHGVDLHIADIAAGTTRRDDAGDDRRAYQQPCAMPHHERHGVRLRAV